MNSTNAVRAALLLLTGAGVAAFVRTEPPRQQWEYRCIEMYYPAAPRQAAGLDSLGRAGWEMVTNLTNSDGATSGLCFKRPRL